MAGSNESITLSTEGRIATITLNMPKKLNALSPDHYDQLGRLLNEVAVREDIYVTVLTGKGRFFSAGADVTVSRVFDNTKVDVRRETLRSFVVGNIYVTNAFYSHPKILVVALNGPVIGLSAAIISHADFIYAAPHTFLLTPFTSLGLVSEGASSVAFVQRLGISKANEALIMSKRITVDELVSSGFVNAVLGSKKDDSDTFLQLVLQEVNNRLGPHLNSDSLLKVKELIRKPQRATLDSQITTEALGGLDRFVRGIPQEEFRKVASGEKKHKL